ncbi:MAG: S1 RNA-binding domain-containing protein [bacterium]
MSIEVGSIVTGKVVKTTEFGAFVEVEGKRRGLIHISQIADTYVKRVEDHLKVNDSVTAKVIGIAKKGNLDLSLKERETPAARPKNEEVKISKPLSPKAGFKEEEDRREHRSAAPFSFEDKLARFMKESQEKIQDMKKNLESKRGGGKKR